MLKNRRGKNTAAFRRAHGAVVQQNPLYINNFEISKLDMTMLGYTCQTRMVEPNNVDTRRAFDAHKTLTQWAQGFPLVQNLLTV